jgi:3'-phosphoadenosine 5'-phosphosulfate sulfotransferase (PAPS reductase)/FAD synthetase
MSDPFKIDGPAVVSFSGGRTSGYMLWRILQAHGGLPSDVVVIFANTGKEAEETLEFVRDCEKWCPIVWVEKKGVVSFETASRNGEPFAELVEARKYLPNPVTRFCTSALKIEPITRYCKSLGWDEWDTAVGIRADEPRRVAKMQRQPDKIMPLVRAGITRGDVLEFWAGNEFDLKLEARGGVTALGNCDLCFMKGADQILSAIRQKPERAIWWIEQEKKIGATFHKDRPSYQEMHALAVNHGDLFGYDESLIECACTD